MRLQPSPAFLCLVSLGFGLGSAEFALRGVASVECQDYSFTRGWALRPGASGWQTREGRAWVSINEDGFRGPSVAQRKPKGLTRIAVLGDSFTLATQVPYERTFCSVLQRELERALRRPVQVLDFGVSGYGTGQEYLTLREEVWKYSPDAVILAVFTGNDLNDNDSEVDSASYFNGGRCRPYFGLQRGDLRVVSSPNDHLFERLYCEMNFAGRRSSLLRLAGSAADAVRLRFSADKKAGADPPGSEEGTDDSIYAPPAGPAWEEAWAITERLIGAIAHESASRKTPFLAVTLSNPMQVYPDAAIRKRYLADVGGRDLFYPEHRLLAYARKNGFEALALAPAMQSYADRNHVFLHGFPNSRLGYGHWNEDAHALAGKAIARALLEDGLL
jgi:hypothetical protein